MRIALCSYDPALARRLRDAAFAEWQQEEQNGGWKLKSIGPRQRAAAIWEVNQDKCEHGLRLKAQAAFRR